MGPTHGRDGLLFLCLPRSEGHETLKFHRSSKACEISRSGQRATATDLPTGHTTVEI